MLSDFVVCVLRVQGMLLFKRKTRKREAHTHTRIVSAEDTWGVIVSDRSFLFFLSNLLLKSAR